MVWGLNGWEKPNEKFLPHNSRFIGNEAYTVMNNNNGCFTASLSLPAGTVLNYMLYASKDKQLRPLNDWDDNKGKNYELRFEHILFRPGFFIFLAGFLPLLLIYFRNRNQTGVTLQASVTGAAPLNTHFRQLDSIRAIAVILVMFHHWLPHDYFLNFIQNGAIGVNIFFVLSGFLITRILLTHKKTAEEKNTSKLRLIANFMMRRSLRIFPIYYLLLLLLLLFQYPELKTHAAYYFSYTANYLFYSRQYFSSYLSHVWSLAVEEQFYLFWPWLIFFVQRKFIPYLIALFIIIGFSSNYIFVEHNWWALVLTPACFDAFGLGALLSYIMVYRNEWSGHFAFLMKHGIWLMLALFVFDIFFPTYIPMRTIHSLLGLWLIHYCIYLNNNRWLNYILNNRFLMFMGKISYGLYLYHLFMPWVRIQLEKFFLVYGIDFLYNHHMPSSIQKEWFFMQQFAFVILIAWLSWIIIEKPVNSLKDKFA